MADKLNRPWGQLAKTEVLELKGNGSDLQPTVIHPDYNLYTEEGSSINDYIYVIRRRKSVVLACLFISIVIVGIASLMMQKTYKATTMVEISPENPKVTGFQEVMDLQIQQQDEFYETQYKLLKSRSLAIEVINKLDLKSHPEFDANKKPGTITIIKNAIAGTIQEALKKALPSTKNQYPIVEEKELYEQENLVNAFLYRVKITPDRDSRLVEVSFVSVDPELSALAVNTLADQYIEWVLEKKLGVTKSAVRSLSKQLSKVKEKLENTQQELSQFAKKWDIVSLDKDLNLTYKQLADLNEALAKSETERLSQEAIYEEVKAGNYELLPQVINDPTIRQLRTEHVRLKSEYDHLDARFGANYPDMKELSAQVVRVRSEIGGQLNEIARSIKKGYRVAKKKEDILRQRTEVQKTRASELNELAIHYQMLESEVATNKGIYQNLLQRLKETEVTSGIRATNVQVIDYAFPPLSHYKPDLLFNILIAAVMGLMGGIMMAFGFEHFDQTIRDEEDIKKRLPLPFMGKIPAANKNEIGTGILEKIVYTNPLSKISEAFRVLKTSVLYSLHTHGPPKALLVTSTQPLEGKTTVSCNLALTMVQSGLRVVLVDADLRRPSLHKIFLKNVKNGFGLSSYLSGESDSDLANIVFQSEINGLDIIPAGPIKQNPADLIDSKRMKDLLNKLVKEYDNVIFDSIPVMELADTRLLSRQVDSVLLVASVGIANREGLQNSVEELVKVGAKILGVVVNKLDFGFKHGSTYDYYYLSEDTGKMKFNRRDKFF
jgi:polysaccharide biosynthesis transport protein